MHCLDGMLILIKSNKTSFFPIQIDFSNFGRKAQGGDSSDRQKFDIYISLRPKGKNVDQSELKKTVFAKFPHITSRLVYTVQFCIHYNMQLTESPYQV